MALFFYIICMNFVQVLSHYGFYEVTAFNTREREFLFNILESNDYAYFLNGVTNEASTLMDVVVDSCCTQDFELLLFKNSIEYACVAKKVQVLLDNDRPDKLPKQSVSETFLNWDEILLWVETKVKENSALKKTVIAKTYEHRDIFILKISSKIAGTKMAVFLVAGEEGRDWLSSALLLNFISRALEPGSKEPLLKYYDIYFLPILNPDGFVYSKQTNRLWAKNRKPIQPNHICSNQEYAVGVNIDRNWIETSDTKYACNSIYSGLKALSEEETQALSYILNSIALRLLAFINLRGFGNLINLPYSKGNKVSTNHNIVMEIMKHTSAVLNMQYNKSYPVGTTTSYFYNFTGNMPDWVKINLNIPIVFTVYMQQENFLPKESDILPLTEQLESLLNISLIISKEIYGSLYNYQTKNASVLSYILLCVCCVTLF